jgi:hypothetical protein
MTIQTPLMENSCRKIACALTIPKRNFRGTVFTSPQSSSAPPFGALEKLPTHAHEKLPTCLSKS